MKKTVTSVFTHEHGQVKKHGLKRVRTSLVPETLAAMTKEERLDHQRQIPLPVGVMFPRNLLKTRQEVFQINLGLYCNQACAHCHVESSPRRTKEQMSLHTLDQCLKVIGNSPNIACVDITGGAPELHVHFRHLVERIRALPFVGEAMEIIDRCNLTVLQEPKQDDLAQFLASNRVRVVASLPCYGEKNVDLQRGNGVFARSIQGLQDLNNLGYGKTLALDLVYNPVGGFLPPDQGLLEVQYKQRLREDFGIEFTRLFCLTNMPIKRFADFLHRRGELEHYMQVLVGSYNPATLDALMCRNTTSVRWDGAVFDCDFNQQLGLEMLHPKTVFDLQTTSELTGEEIATNAHCFGCTAGKGSSCGGEVV
ncbi:hypothetical protein BASA81_018348 [Batrachochytrium salamandrivorans]|nr:hypothetical protein BASA81_018348 [Batrachochytrium salamandrivorans]